MSDLQLHPASFRGVPFGLRASQRGIGRRTVVHEFVQRDDPYVEDLGRLPRRFTLDAFVVGKDWKAKSEALAKALEEKGPGTLVHPFAGEVTVSLAGEVTVREGVDVGGLHVVFSIPFVKDSVPDSPTASPNMAAGASRAASAAALASGGFLDSCLSLVGEGSVVLADLQAKVQNVIGTARAVMRGDLGVIVGLVSATGLIPPATLSNLLAAGQLGATLYSQIGSLADSFKGVSASGGSGWLGMLGSGADDAGSQSDAGTTARAAAGMARQKGNAFLQLAGMVETPIYLDNAGGTLAAMTGNAVALARFEREAATVEAAKAYAKAVPESRAEAAGMRSGFIAAVETVLENTPSDGVFAAFTDLRAATVALMAENAGQAPDIVSVSTLIPLPSLVLCHRHGGSISLDADLVTRNRVIHPGFVPAGAVEVLKYGR